MHLNIEKPEASIFYTFKVLVVGEPSVGKTSLVQRASAGQFSTIYKSTIGCDYANKIIKWDESTQISIHFWDLAGQDRISAAVRSYFFGTDGALCVCDITRKDTREQVIKWKESVLEKSVHKGTNVPINPPCVMLANKIDMFNTADDPMYKKYQRTKSSSKFNDNNKEVESSVLKLCEPNMTDVPIDPSKTLDDEIYTTSKQAGFLGGFATSAKENIGIDDALRCLITEMIKRHDQKLKDEIENQNNDNDIVVLSDHIKNDNFEGSDEEFVKINKESGNKKGWFNGWCNLL